jgi:HPt (histidine-containing phosphotransfer) domain-containing protein/PAS domain-containing protein
MHNLKRLLILICLLGASSIHARTQAENGLLDLRGQNLDRPLTLNGSWAFYWQAFVEPEDLTSHVAQRSLIPVPSLWTNVKEKYPTFGYATYHLSVQLDAPQPLALYFPATIYSASRIFVDGVEIARYGKLGTSAETSSGGQGSKLYAFTPKEARFDVVIQVANFEIFLAGMSSEPVLGSLDELTWMRFKKFSQDVFIIGALFIMGIYHLCLFSLRRSDPSTLFFGLLCLSVGSYLMVTRDGVLLTLMPTLDFNLRLRIYNITWMSGVPMFTWFAYFCFPKQYKIWVPLLMSTVTLFYLGLATFTHPRFFVAKALAFQILTSVMCVHALAAITFAWYKKVEGVGFFLVGILFVIVGALLDILAIQGYIPTPPMGGVGLFAFTFFQSYMIARKFSFAFKRVKISEKAIRKLSDELKQEHAKVLSLNTNLERIVDEKTRDIRSIMEHIPLGIFMIKPDFHIHKDHSRHLQDIFTVSQEQLEKAVATDLLFQHSTVSSDARSQVISALDTSLGESAWNFEVNAHTLPTEIEQVLDKHHRVFDLTWNGIENSEMQVDKILVTMRDVTELRKLQERSRDQQEELEFIGEILNISSERFLRFIQSCQTFIQENSRLIHSQSMRAQNLDVLKVLFINMHTIKGAARSLYFKKMTQVFHDVEQYYATLQREQETVWDITRMENDLKEAERIVGIYEKIAREKLGRISAEHRQVEFHVELIGGLYYDLCETTRGRELPADVIEMVDRLKAILHVKLFKDVEQVFDDLVECLPVLARDLHKEAPAFHLDHPGILLTDKAEDVFRRVFVHLLRNSMDHGLETAEERIQAGKEARGQITVQLIRQDHRLNLMYRDDGRGLHVARIRDIGVARGLISETVDYAPAALAELIFDSGLSTANQVSDISGRGVGMDAVRNFLQEAGGSITIQLGEEKQPGFFAFQFLIDLPFILFEERLASNHQRAA